MIGSLHRYAEAALGLKMNKRDYNAQRKPAAAERKRLLEGIQRALLELAPETWCMLLPQPNEAGECVYLKTRTKTRVQATKDMVCKALARLREKALVHERRSAQEKGGMHKRELVVQQVLQLLQSAQRVAVHDVVFGPRPDTIAKTTVVDVAPPDVQEAVRALVAVGTRLQCLLRQHKEAADSFASLTSREAPQVLGFMDSRAVDNLQIQLPPRVTEALELRRTRLLANQPLKKTPSLPDSVVIRKTNSNGREPVPRAQTKSTCVRMTKQRTHGAIRKAVFEHWQEDADTDLDALIQQVQRVVLGYLLDASFQSNDAGMGCEQLGRAKVPQLQVTMVRS